MSEVLVKHSIKTVARQTGLSPHVIRAWEKRYQTVRPTRSEGKQRLYSAADIDRLTLLRQATGAGFSIGTIASLPLESLQSLLATADRGVSSVGGSGEVEEVGLPKTSDIPRFPFAMPDPSLEGAFGFLEGAFEAVLRMDATALEGLLERASVAMGQMRLLSELIIPLVERIGDGWLTGQVKVAQEHVATAVLRTFLGNIARPIALHPRAPVLVVTTPSGQLHELGAIIVAAAATSMGWRVVYGGACLPAEEIASMSIQQGARAVGLSVVHPTDDPVLSQELRLLRRLLPGSTRILVGGRASSAYQSDIDAIGAVRVGSLEDLRSQLNQLRGEPPPARLAMDEEVLEMSGNRAYSAVTEALRR
jgi:DNA-binding transcriptional MerR regulator/methylmalonyl-CoA mutase cobalamin-binding subunit